DHVRAAGVDAFLTADLRHHPVSEARAHSPLALLDAAHWATEWPWCELAAAELDEISDRHGRDLRVHVSRTVTAPWTAHAAASRATDTSGAPSCTPGPPTRSDFSTSRTSTSASSSSRTSGSRSPSTPRSSR